MRVSVALATYNGSKYLKDQLESIAAQTLPPCEMVLCDDGSRDDTVEIARQFSRSAPFPVLIVRNDIRLNFRANFMKAAQLCDGELIAFCDQDDLWRADKLSMVAAGFADDEVLMVHHNARVFSAERGIMGNLTGNSQPSRVFPPLSRTPFEMAPGFTQTFRRCLLPLSELREATVDYWNPHEAREGGPSHTPMAHDQWIFMMASALGKVSYLRDALVDYRQHETNLYGMEFRPQSRWQRLTQKLKEFSDYGHLELAFSRIAQVLAAAAGYPMEAKLARRACEAATLYQAVASAYGERNAAYAAASASVRAAAWMQLVRKGRYEPGKGFYFAHQGLLRDFVHGVCRAKLRHAPRGVTANDQSLKLMGALEPPAVDVTGS